MSELNERQRTGLPGNDVTLRPDQFGAWLFKRKQRPNGSIVEEIPVDPDAGGLLSDYGRTADQLYGTWSEVGNRIAERSKQDVRSQADTVQGSSRSCTTLMRPAPVKVLSGRDY